MAAVMANGPAGIVEYPNGSRRTTSSRIVDNPATATRKLFKTMWRVSQSHGRVRDEPTAYLMEPRLRSRVELVNARMRIPTKSSDELAKAK